MAKLAAKDRVLERMKQEYINILKCLYPSKGSTGFTERNLSVNYATAYKAENETAVVWYEFTFGKGKHFDAVIVNPLKKEVVIVESKRFTNPSNKAAEINEDIARIQSLRSEENLKNEFEKRLPDWNEYSIVGTIIADVWTEKDEKIEVFDSFKEQRFSSQTFAACENLINLLNSEKTARCFYEEFCDVEESGIEECVKKNYKLLKIQWVVR